MTPRGEQPLAVADHGYRFAGGRYETVDGETFMTGQMYVEHWIPAQVTHPYPIVHITGGGQTGTNYTGTPDGRPGWASFFVSRGYAVYVCDQPARGRSNFHPALHSEAKGQAVAWVERRFTAARRFNLWPQAERHTQWLGEGVAGDPVFDQFYASQMRSLASSPEMEALNRHAVAALIDEIGPAIIQTHSQSGAYGWAIADERPHGVKAILAVEPSGPPVYDLEMTGAPDYFRDAPAPAKRWGITNGPIRYEPPLNDPAELAFVREATAEAPDCARCWRQRDPARTIPALAGMPILIVTGEASYHAPYDHCTSRYLRQAGVEHDFVRLAERGIRGNGHMLMIERNNLAVAAVMADWLDQRGL